MNFKEETINKIEENGASINEIKWIGSQDFHIPIQDFWKISNFEYDNGYGGQRIPYDLVIVGDYWWMERAEYDGAEWWEFKVKPRKPRFEAKLDKLPLGAWSTLAEAIIEERERRKEEGGE